MVADDPLEHARVCIAVKAAATELHHTLMICVFAPVMRLGRRVQFTCLWSADTKVLIAASNPTS